MKTTAKLFKLNNIIADQLGVSQDGNIFRLEFLGETLILDDSTPQDVSLLLVLSSLIKTYFFRWLFWIWLLVFRCICKIGIVFIYFGLRNQELRLNHMEKVLPSMSRVSSTHFDLIPSQMKLLNIDSTSYFWSTFTVFSLLVVVSCK